MNLQDELKCFCKYLRTDPLYLDDVNAMVSTPHQPSVSKTIGYVSEYIERYRRYMTDYDRLDREELLMRNKALIATNIIATVMKSKMKK